MIRPSKSFVHSSQWSFADLEWVGSIGGFRIAFFVQYLNGMGVCSGRFSLPWCLQGLSKSIDCPWCLLTGAISRLRYLIVALMVCFRIEVFRRHVFSIITQTFGFEQSLL